MPAPLTPDELQALKLWQLRSVSLFSTTVLLFFLMILGANAASVPAALRVAMPVAVILFVLVGAAQHGRLRCPRCGAKIGKQTRFMLPRACKSCGVAFR